jgi:hypothetical protein
MKSTIFVLAFFSLTLPAFANPPQLKGDYVWTYSDTCLVSPSGFSAPPGLAPGGAAALGQTYSSSGANTGIEHFNGDGTGFVRGSGINVSLGSPPLPANRIISFFVPIYLRIQFGRHFHNDYGPRHVQREHPRDTAYLQHQRKSMGRQGVE